MQVANHYFENGITHFTQRINKCISLGCANGEVAPFVGHNAFLRWSAMQDASFYEDDENLVGNEDVSLLPIACIVPPTHLHVTGDWS
jgi:Glycosyl transferase family group 2